MGRIGDAVRTLLQPSWDAKLRRDHGEVRMMVTELNDALERLNAWLARMAKRQQRESRRMLEAETASEETPQLPPPTVAAQPPMSRAEWKAQVRARMMGGGGYSPPPPSEVSE